MTNKRPSFQWYPMDYLSDLNVAKMSWAQRGVYIHLLNYCWIEGSIPSGLAELKQIVSDPTISLEGVLKCFHVNPKKPNEMTHPRLEKERAKQDENRKKAVASGKKGGLQRAENKRLSKGPLVNPSSKTQAKPSFSSSSSSSLKDKKTCRNFNKFDEAWGEYPKKDGKKEAAKYYKSSVRDQATHDRLMAGMRKYIKNVYEDPRPWKNGSTFFNNWEDWADWVDPAVPGISADGKKEVVL